MARPPAGQARQYFLVEGILAERGQGRQKKFLVKWSGYTVGESTWEPAAGLRRAEAAIAAFREGQMERARQKRVPAPAVGITGGVRLEREVSVGARAR